MNHRSIVRIRFDIFLVVAFSIWAGVANHATAQQSSFGQSRSTGSRLSGGSSLGSGSSLQGQLPGNVSRGARYLRGNRRRGAFIGANARQRFVGNQQATTQGRVQTAAETARPRTDVTQSINKRRSIASAGQIYNPTLTVSFQHQQVDTSSLATIIEKRVSEKLSLKSGQLAVAIQARTATLTGTVSSVRERRLAEALLMFEPGISRVENQVRIETGIRK